MISSFFILCAWNTRLKYIFTGLECLRNWKSRIPLFLLFNQFIGNLVVAILFHLNTNVTIIFRVLTIISSFATIGFIFLQDPSSIRNGRSYLETKVHPSASTLTSRNEASGSADTKFSITASIQVFTSIHFLLLTPFLIAGGFRATFTFGLFPALIHTRSTKYYIMAFFGINCVVTAFFLGKLSD